MTGPMLTLALLTALAPSGYVEVRGVQAQRFTPAYWVQHTLNFNFDLRRPLLAPRPGKLQNIYAPTIIAEPDGWRIYYGGWDGIDKGNDLIYTTFTRDFSTFLDRHCVIDKGVFIHVNNCSALKRPQGDYLMMCTTYPDEKRLNKPALFTSPDGLVWNGELPYEPSYKDYVQIEGYPPFADADINGMNVILWENGKLRLYFNNFHDFGHIYRATSTDLKHFTFEGPVLAAPHVVNDVKKFKLNGETWYLMVLHMNQGYIWYALSRDGLHFDKEQVLTAHQDDADKYIVAVGLVVREGAVLGVLYGAGAVKTLDHNRIFAKWLQRKVVFVCDDGRQFTFDTALGPDKCLLNLSDIGTLKGHFEVYAEDGLTPLYQGETCTLKPGQVWELRTEPASAEGHK